MSQYKDGTASVNNNSNIVTGSGTLWIANISAGDLFTKAGDDVAYTVAGVTNNTILTLTAPYSGSTSTGSTYGITIGFTAGGLPLLSAGDLNTAAIYNEAMKNIDNYNLSNLGTAAFADKVGLVSSGAIIESGSNANGNFTRYIDGTMVCTKKSSAILTGTAYPNISGAFYGTSGVESFSAAFISTPIVQVTIDRDGDPIIAPLGGGLVAITSTSVQYRPITNSSTASVKLEITATGRWF